MQIVVESLETKRHDYNTLLSSHSLSSDDILFIVHDDLLVITDIIDNVKNIYLGCTPAFQVNYNREVAMLCLQVRKAGEVLQEIGGLPRMNSKPIIHVHVPCACQNIDFNDNDWKTYVH
ncbi:MAG: hypothetical protein WAL66_19970 [Nitrososphaeraceae archaeon]